MSDFGLAFDGSRKHDRSYFARYRRHLLGHGPKPISQHFPKKRKLAKSLVGTTSYMAPEVLAEKSFYDENLAHVCRRSEICGRRHVEDSVRANHPPNGQDDAGPQVINLHLTSETTSCSLAAVTQESGLHSLIT
ncbi:hypothetical protein V8E54_006325 [Elaphomyces granulatus]